MTVGNQACELCASAGGVVLWRSDLCRVVRVDDPSYPGFCRVIWNDHIREMTDLDATHQIVLMRVVFAVEAMVRRLFAPDKINLASFGNMVPHVHWHIIPRWLDDRHFPEPVWGKVQREATAQRAAVSDELMAQTLIAVLSEIEKG
ncbi:MAG: HIT family protein [Azonexus sp.]|nr:HIT family protein [Azonexus sp.]HMT79755.1 HIT family protein [Azonexus sp.]